MARSSFKDIDCAVAQALEQVGDAWTLLILRSAFMDVRRFEDLQEHLGISRKVLSERLKRMIGHGLIEYRKLPGDGRAKEYRLTDKGRDLHVVILALMDWGEAWMPKRWGRRIRVLDRSSGEELRPLRPLTRSGKPVSPRSIVYEAGPGAGEVFYAAEQIRARRA